MKNTKEDLFLLYKEISKSQNHSLTCIIGEAIGNIFNPTTGKCVVCSYFYFYSGCSKLGRSLENIPEQKELFCKSIIKKYPSFLLKDEK